MTLSVNVLINFVLCGFNQISITYLINIGHGKQALEMAVHNVHRLVHYDNRQKLPKISSLDHMPLLEWTIILHFALTFLSMWKWHNILEASWKITFIAFIRAISLSLTTTVGYESSIKNNLSSLLRAHIKLSWHSDVSNINAALKVNPI